MSCDLLASLSARFTWIDWSVVLGYLALTTWLGTALAGRQATIRDFFLGGRKLPWYAVSGSIIATEISAVTFVGVPYVVFNTGGNFTYLQLGLIGNLLARIIVGYVLIPAYYKREIYSPYDYMGNQLGGNVRGVASALFALGGVLAQSARVYLTALVLTVVLSDQLGWLADHCGGGPLAWAIILITVVAVAWTLIGGIATVIWTDVLLFLMFLAGAVVALATVAANLDGGLAGLFSAGWHARETTAWWDWGKFTLFDFETGWPAILTKPYTIWAAVFAATWGGLGPYGTDQLIVQRMFCCRSARHARWAMITSAVGLLVTVMVMLVGVGLYAYYRQSPPDLLPDVARHPDFPMLTGEALTLFNCEPNRIFPIFIVDVIPIGLKGMLIAAIFAAAISSLTSILAALSQTTMSACYLPLRKLLRPAAALDEARADRHAVRAGRLLVLFWGAILALMAYVAAGMTTHYPAILDLALAMAGFTGGALLAGFLLGFLPLRIDGWGYQFAAPLSVLFVFAAVFHAPWSLWVTCSAGAALLLWWLVATWTYRPARVPVLPMLLQTAVLAIGIAAMILVNCRGYFGVNSPDQAGPVTYDILSWPWYVPLGSVTAFVLAWLLANRRATPMASAQ